jgi:hypothetical protein
MEIVEKLEPLRSVLRAGYRRWERRSARLGRRLREERTGAEKEDGDR